MFSNMQRARTGHVRDWVVINFYDGEHHVEGQLTVVTETREAIVGERTLKGREAECREAGQDGLAPP